MIDKLSGAHSETSGTDIRSAPEVSALDLVRNADQA